MIFKSTFFKTLALIGFVVFFLAGCTSTLNITITFESNGGTDVPIQQVEKGTKLTPPNITKEGYTLEGWYGSIDGGVTLQDKWAFSIYTVTTDITLYANWVVNQYTITFDSDGGTYVSEITQDYNTNIITPTNPIKKGYTFVEWSPSIPNQMPANHMSVKAIWLTNQYTISFESNEGSSIESITQDYNMVVLEPTTPTRPGYTFDGWYVDRYFTNMYVFSTTPDKDITVYAKWNINTYQITYVLNDGVNDNNNPNTFQAIDSFVLKKPMKEGYTFSGWYDNAEFIGDEITEIVYNTIEDITLYSNWTINLYEIQYNIVPDNPMSSIILDQDETIEKISLGGGHSSALTSKGRVFIWGFNEYGQLGDGTNAMKTTPTEITSRFNLGVGEKIIQVSLGKFHSSALTSTGRVFTWGFNGSGQLGDGFKTNKHTPIQITNKFNLGIGDKIIQVSLGFDFSSAVSSSGRVFTWGFNGSGQLGDGTTTNKTTPTEITNRISLGGGDKVIQVSLGNSHSSVLTSSGRVFAWGNNGSGQIGDGTTVSKSIPTEITSKFNLGVGEKIIQVSLGGYHSSALTSVRRIFTWGRNDEGQIGDGTTTNKTAPLEITNKFNLSLGETIIQTSLGANHSAALSSVGRIFTWGRNDDGQIGDGTTVSKSIPTEITSKFNLDVGEKIIQVSMEDTHSATLTTRGRILIWGKNNYGQLGDRTTINKSQPSEVKTNILEIIYQEKNEYSKQLVNYTPVLEGYTFSGWYSNVDLTSPYMFTTMPAQNVKVYGKWTAILYNLNYQLDGGINHIGNPDNFTITTPTISLKDPEKEGYTFLGWYYNADANGDRITEITLGTIGDIVLFSKWNINQYDILYNIAYDEPLSSILLKHEEKIIQVTVGNRHSSALTSMGRIFIWGANGSGELGDGTTTNKTTPIEITNKFNLSTGETIIQASLGANHSAVLTSAGRVFTWGFNGSGQLGDGTTTNKTTPTEITHRFYMGIGDKIIQVSLGFDFSSAVSSSGRVFTWGFNGSGQLGDGTTTNKTTPTEITNRISLGGGDKVIQVSLGNSHSSVLTSSGRVFAWGNNGSGQLGDGTTTNKTTPTEITSKFNLGVGEKIIQVSLGGYHSSATTSIGRLFLWGRNGHNQLGDGTTSSKSTPTDITNYFSLSVGEVILKAPLGSYHSSALTSRGRIFMWGRNDDGQLGDGTSTNILIPNEITNRFNLNAGELITHISLGSGHSSILTTTGKIFLCGRNSSGQIGDGTTLTKVLPNEINTNSYALVHQVTYGYSSKIMEYDPMISEFAFTGWYLDVYLTIPYIFTNMPAQNLTLYGKLVSDILSNVDKDYYTTGQWGDWGTAIGKEENKMIAIALDDSRISSVVDQLEGATALYIYEWIIPTTYAGWTITYNIDGVSTTVDGNFALKIVRTDVGDSDAVNWWGQSPESGKLNNLTPSTLYIPPFVEANVDNAGSWNDNPIALSGGTYYIAYAEVGSVKYLGLVPKSA